MEKMKWKTGFRLIAAFCILIAAFFVGRILGTTAAVANQRALENAGKDWGLSFREEGKPPVADVSGAELAKLDAYFMEDTQDKVLYLTFDAGYENGNTSAILDALKKHSVPAAFFIVGHYLESSPELVRRMIDEGHIVANHSFHHPDMTKKSKAEFTQEIADLEALYQEMFSRSMSKYYRPPQGKFSEDTLKWAKELGFKTMFWSLAYADWDVKNQPSRETALDKLTKRIHPGAIVLLHSTSKTNGEILDELLTKWGEMGYTFKSLDEYKECK